MPRIFMNIDKLKASLMAEQEERKPITPSDLLSTGCTTLDLACSGRPQGGLVKGHYFFFVGDSSSGKTFMTLTCFAEAARRASFNDFDFIHNDSENGALMDFEHFFGSKVAERVQVSHHSTLDQFYFDLDDRIKAKRPFIYVQDSMDSLQTNEQAKKFKEAKAVARGTRKGDDMAGSYNMEKAKVNSQRLPAIIAALRDSGSILIIIAQTRDNITDTYNPKTRGGGHALKFYSALEMWTSVKTKLRRTVRGKERQIGIMTKVQVKKNRISGKEWTVEVPIYHSYGMDNTGACIDYLIEEKHWDVAKGATRIQAPEFNFDGTRDALIKKIEAEGVGAEQELKKLVATVWREIEQACALKRKPKYE